MQKNPSANSFPSGRISDAKLRIIFVKGIGKQEKVSKKGIILGCFKRKA